MSSNNVGHLISKTITIFQHFATLHTSLNNTSLHLSTLHSLSFTLHYPLISTLPYTSPHFTTLIDTSLPLINTSLPSHFNISLHFTHFTQQHFTTLIDTSLPLIYTSLPFHFNTSLHFTTLHSTTLHYTYRHFTPSHFNTSLHFTTLHSSTLHYTYRHFTPSHLHFTTLSFQHFPTLHHTSLIYTSLHLSTLHSLSFTLHYPLIWHNPITFPIALFHLTSLN